MNQDIRRELISENLSIKPISHGMVYTFQVCLPDSKRRIIPTEKRQAIERSLLAHRSNLISLIVRRTNAYDENIEYELVHGADWLQVAQELDIEKVWAWVFDMSDEQAITATSEMEALLDSPKNTAYTPENMGPNISDFLDEKLQAATESIRNSVTYKLSEMSDNLDKNLKILNYRIDKISEKSIDAEPLEIALAKLDSILGELQKTKLLKSRKRVDTPIDLLAASDQEIRVALEQVGTQGNGITAAIAAVNYWKHADKGLSWRNLEISATVKKSTHKIRGFARGTYERLREVAKLSEDDDV